VGIQHDPLAPDREVLLPGPKGVLPNGQIHPWSYVWSFAITLGFTALILLLMRKKLDKVDMVESLKSVD
jgi:hypothetical protein